MRGTLRITWLLLALSIFSESSAVNTSVSTASTAAATTTATKVIIPSATVQVATTTPISTSKNPATEAPSVATPNAVTKAVITTQQPTIKIKTLSPITSLVLTAISATQSSTRGNIAHPPTTTTAAINPPNTTITSNIMTVISTKVTSQPTVSPVNNSPESTTATESKKGINVSTEQPGENDTEKTTNNTDAPTPNPSVGVMSKNTQTTSMATKENSEAGPITSTMTAKGFPLTGSTSSSQIPERNFTSSQPSTVKDLHVTTENLAPTITTPAGRNGIEIFKYSLDEPESNKNNSLVALCKHFMSSLRNGTCTITLQNNGNDFDSLKIEVDVNRVTEQFKKITAQEPTDSKTLIAILASCGALLIMIIILGVCVSHRRKPYNENQQHLTEELHTVENGYHDNPTLEVMEVQPEMQEKKMALNGEFSDSWIVPIDNLMKEDMPDEEDTHL
ncbi:podocalyxin [Anableps anableps]